MKYKWPIYLPCSRNSTIRRNNGDFLQHKIMQISVKMIFGHPFLRFVDERKFEMNLLLQSHLGLPSHFIRASEISLIDSLVLYSKPCCTTVNPKMQLNKQKSETARACRDGGIKKYIQLNKDISEPNQRKIPVNWLFSHYSFRDFL